MNTQRLSQLIFLFERIGGNELTLAAVVARKAVEEMEEKDLTPERTYLLNNQLWGLVSTAIDHAGYPDYFNEELERLEYELAGRVLNYRLLRGWLIRAPDAPKYVENFID
ncbi:hypothetical protein H8R20_18155 [Morganella morganii]|uniref:hypothetical protein n=1 Tax=Morganella morganii TaxID=582 RepID=UPI0016455E5A|nr:hypothetical protein [Morganella morganii]MBC3997511.1 hypothetical protein [Morganella morganii]